MVCKVDGNLQLDSCDWSMYSSILNYLSRWFISLKFKDMKTHQLEAVAGLDKPDNGVDWGKERFVN